MPRPIKLPNDFYNHDYVELSRKEYNAKNKIRLLAMANIKDGMSLQHTGKVLKTPWKTIQGWLYSFRKNGLSGLYVKTTKYKPAKITREIRDWISAFMKNLYSNSVGVSLTGSQLHILVKQHFDIECCLQTIYNTLHSLGLSWISCRSKHPKSDKEIQELYKKTLQVMSKS